MEYETKAMEFRDLEVGDPFWWSFETQKDESTLSYRVPGGYQSDGQYREVRIDASVLDSVVIRATKPRLTLDSLEVGTIFCWEDDIYPKPRVLGKYCWMMEDGLTVSRGPEDDTLEVIVLGHLNDYKERNQ